MPSASRADREAISSLLRPPALPPGAPRAARARGSHHRATSRALRAIPSHRIDRRASRSNPRSRPPSARRRPSASKLEESTWLREQGKSARRLVVRSAGGERSTAMSSATTFATAASAPRASSRTAASSRGTEPPSVSPRSAAAAAGASSLRGSGRRRHRCPTRNNLDVRSRRMRIDGGGARSPETTRRLDAVIDPGAASTMDDDAATDARADSRAHEEEKVGVLLLNLGGPETLDDVQPFLYNLFADPDIIRLPPALRFLQSRSRRSYPTPGRPSRRRPTRPSAAARRCGGSRTSKPPR